MRQSARWFLLWVAGSNCRAPLLATGPLLPLMMRTLHMAPGLAGGMTALPLLGMALLSLPGGLLGDRVGARWVLVAAQLAIAGFGALRGVAGSAGSELAAAGLLGAAIGVSQPALVQMAGAVAPQRPSAAAAVVANGFVMGSLAAGALTVPLALAWSGSASWRGAFVCWGAWGVFGALGWLWVGAPPAERRSPALTLGQMRAVAGARGLLPVTLVFALENLVFYAMMTWLPSFYVHQRWSLTAASLTVTAIALGSIGGAAVAPLLLRWGGFRRALALGAFAGLIGVAGIVWWPPAGLAWAFLVGAGNTVPFTLGMAAPPLLVAPDRVGAAAGLLLGIGYLGSVAGPSAVGVLTQLSGGFGGGMGFLLAISLAMVAAAAAVPAHLGRKGARTTVGGQPVP